MKDSNSFVYGRKPVFELLTNEPERITKLYFKQSISDHQLSKIKALASQSKIPVSFVPGGKLMELVGKVNDQGMVAEVSPVAYHDLQEWVEHVDLSTNPIVLVMDELEDPHNVGAIIRTAVATNVDAIIIPKHRQAAVNSTVYKTSAGQVSKATIIRVNNSKSAVEDLRQAGFWSAGLDMEGSTSFWDMDFSFPLVLIVGGEGKGLRPSTRKYCDHILSLPMKNNVESLNVSVSTAVVLYEIMRQRSIST